MKAAVYEYKVNTRKELFQRILSAERRIITAAALHNITIFLVTRVGKCIQAVVGHFEQLA
jgi:hypothetical protein